jgi:haloalkane dehalogenase
MSKAEADSLGTAEERVLMEQKPAHYPEFAAFLDKAGKELFFLAPSGSVYRVGPAGAGTEICVRLPKPSEADVDEDLFEFLRWLVDGVGGEWSVAQLLQTKKLSEMPRTVYKLFPFVGQFLQVQGHYMHYVDVGAAPGKPTVVLLHGNPTWSFLYREIIPKISNACRAIAPDYLGFGLSDKPADERWYTLENHTKSFTEFMDKLGLKDVILVVQDWGGPIGFGYALEHLDNVRGMVIMNTWAWPDPSRYHATVFPWRMWHAPFTGAYYFLRKNVLTERGLFHATGSFEKMKAGPVIEGYTYMFPTARSRIGMLAFPRNIPLKPGHFNWDRMAHMEQGVTKLPFPCRLVWGERDNVFPVENAYRFQKLIPNCTAPRMIPHGRHFVQEDAPQEIAEEVLALL